MNKIETIFDRDERFKVTPKIRAGTEWVFAGEGIATEKLDGMNINLTIQSGKVIKVEKRRNPSKVDKALGVEPGYIEAHREDPGDQHIFKAVDNTEFVEWPDGSWSCEAVGPKIQGNPLGLTGPECVAFSLITKGFYSQMIIPDVPRTFDGLKQFLADFESRFSPGHKGEGIVFHHPDGRMAKIKAKDF